MIMSNSSVFQRSYISPKVRRANVYIIYLGGVLCRHGDVEVFTKTCPQGVWGEGLFYVQQGQAIQICYVNPTILVGMCRTLETEKA